MLEVSAINQRFFSLIVMVALLGPGFAFAAGSVRVVGFAVLMSFLSAVSAIICMVYGRHNRLGLYVRFLLILCLAVSMPSFFAGTGPIVRENRLVLRDEELLALDRFFLGGFFPDGQLALAVDRSEWVGPTSFLGKLFTEIFQLFYVSYYIWGYGLMGLLSLQYYMMRREGITDKERLCWIQLKMFMCAWLGTYILNFVINLMVPAVSPRLYIADRFVHPLDGFGPAAMLRNFVYSQAAGSYGTFPSGHTALSWLTALMASYTFPFYGRLATVAAVMITFATVYLRFHYVIDLIGAVPLILFGLLYGGFLPSSVYDRLTTNVSFRFFKRRNASSSSLSSSVPSSAPSSAPSGGLV
jgi:membrane-associated phospholipid phosphatase